MPGYLYWLVPFAVWAATVVVLAWPGRRTPQPPSFAPTRVDGADQGHFFFLPSTPTAWTEVCRNAETSDGTTPGPWSHPLIGEALDEAVPTIKDGKSRLTYDEFARVYEPRRQNRLEHCTTAYLQHV